MLLSTASMQSGNALKDAAPEEEAKWRCPHPPCGKPLDYFEGFMDRSGPLRRTVKKRLITRTAIDPVRGTAKSGQLYSQRVIEEGQTFYAKLECPPDLKLVLQRLVERAFTARIGTGTSRGQGWVEVRYCHVKAFQPWISAETRYKQFLARYGKPVLAVTLLSDGIFVDDYLRDSGIPALHQLESLKIEPSNWNQTPIQAYTATRLIFGFDGYPLQLPRVPRLSVCAGSAFLFAANVDQPTIPSGSGMGWIGDNQRDGYGQAALWHPFHLSPEKEVVHG